MALFEGRGKPQYISNKTHRDDLGQLFGALRSNQHQHKILKALAWLKRFRRRELTLLGFVLVVDVASRSRRLIRNRRSGNRWRRKR